MKIISIGHQEFLKMIDLLSHSVSAYMESAGYRFSAIVPIPRGGLIPAVYLSHRLDIPIDINFTFPGRSGGFGHPPILVVEDVADTGKTLQNLCGNLRSTDVVASLVLKPQSVFIPQFYAAQYEDWVSWPWERGE